MKRFRPHPSYKLKGGVELDFLTWSVKGELQLVLNIIWDVDVKVQLTLGDDWSSCEKRAHELSMLTGKRHKTYIVFWKDCRSASVSSMASLAWNQHRRGYKRKHRNWSQQRFKSVLFCNPELFFVICTSSCEIIKTLVAATITHSKTHFLRPRPCFWHWRTKVPLCWFPGDFR